MSADRIEPNNLAGESGVPVEHSRWSARLGDSGEVGCACGWKMAYEGESSAECAEVLFLLFDAHLLTIDPTLCPACSGCGQRGEGRVGDRGTAATWPCERCDGTGQRATGPSDGGTE